jgi:hypothetical protein
MIPFTLTMEAIRSSGTWILTRVTQRNIPEDGILHSHRLENLKSSCEVLNDFLGVDWNKSSLIIFEV